MQILLFGITQDIVGNHVITLPLPKEQNNSLPTTVAALKMYLTKHYPALEKLTALAVAVNNNYANDTQEIQPNDEIALIPPVSGG